MYNALSLFARYDSIVVSGSDILYIILTFNNGSDSVENDLKDFILHTYNVSCIKYRKETISRVK